MAKNEARFVGMVQTPTRKLTQFRTKNSQICIHFSVKVSNYFLSTVCYRDHRFALNMQHINYTQISNLRKVYPRLEEQCIESLFQ